MIYEKEVKELLGAEVYKTFLAAVDSGEISEQQMADFAFELHEKVGVSSKELGRANCSNMTEQQPGLCLPTGISLILPKEKRTK